MADSTTRARPAETESAERALAYLGELSADMRGGAILDGDGRVLACSGEEAEWKQAAGALFAAGDGAAGEPVEQVHVATEGGEVFALREAGLAAAIVTDRLVLASLMTFDMRSVLRDLAAERG